MQPYREPADIIIEPKPRQASLFWSWMWRLVLLFQGPFVMGAIVDFVGKSHAGLATAGFFVAAAISFYAGIMTFGPRLRPRRERVKP